MRAPRVVAVALLVGLATLAVLGLAAGAAPTVAEAGERSGGSPGLEGVSSVELTEENAEDPLAFDQVVRIDLTEDGDATWTAESRFHLEDEEDHEAFEDFAEQVVAGERDVGYDRETFQRFLDRSTADREMTIEDAGWHDPAVEPLEPDEEAGIEENESVGIIAFEVTWVGFAEVSGDSLELGDVFHAERGTWLPALEAGQRLEIHPPPNYAVEDAATAPENGVLVWEGPHEFEPDEMGASYVQAATPAPPEPPTTLEDLLGWMVAAVLLVGLVVLLYVVYALARDRPIPYLDRWLRPERATASGGPPDASETTPPGNSGVPPADPGTAPDGEAASTSDGASGASTEPVDPELLSDEERVLHLLKRNGGRMKQASIVEETGWSNAKVSQLLSQMDEDDEIDKLRIGRENLITLPDVDPTGGAS